MAPSDKQVSFGNALLERFHNQRAFSGIAQGGIAWGKCHLRAVVSWNSNCGTAIMPLLCLRYAGSLVLTGK